MDINLLREVLTQFIQDFFPDCLGAVLFGSYSHNTQHELSDIDLAIFDSRIGKTSRSKYNYRGLEIDVVMYPSSRITAIIIDNMSRRGGIHVMLHNSIIIKEDASGFVQSVLDFINYELPSYLSQNKEYEINKSRMLVTNALDDLHADSDCMDKSIISYRVVSNVINMYLSERANIFNARKYKINLFKKLFPNIYFQMDEQIKLLLNEDKIDAFKAFFVGLLELHGGKLSFNDFKHYLSEGTKVTIIINKNAVSNKHWLLNRHLNDIGVTIRYTVFNEENYIIHARNNNELELKILESCLKDVLGIKNQKVSFQITINNLRPIFINNLLMETIEAEIAKFYSRFSVIKYAEEIFLDDHLKFIIGLFLAHFVGEYANFQPSEKIDFFENAFNDWILDVDIFNNGLVSLDKMYSARKQSIDIIKENTINAIDIILHILKTQKLLSTYEKYSCIIDSIREYFSCEFSEFSSILRTLTVVNDAKIPTYERLDSTVYFGNDYNYIMKYILSIFIGIVGSHEKATIAYAAYRFAQVNNLGGNIES